MSGVSRLRDEARVLLSLVRGQPKAGTHAARLDAFYRPQAAHYDRFRARLLHGRAELIDQLDPPPGSRVLELGAGTGGNLRFLEPRLEQLAAVTLVDLCPALLEQARARTQGLDKVQVVEADATRYQPDQAPDILYFSYALSMIPDWRAAIDNAFAILAPGGKFGVVDFYVSAASGGPGSVRHGPLTRHVWPRWFAHDGVRLGPEPLRALLALMPDHSLTELLAPIPYLPGLRVPYFRFVGTKP